MYYPSQYNHLIEVEADCQPVRVLTNLLYGAADIVNETVFKAFMEGETCGMIPEKRLPRHVWDHFVKKGFVYTDPRSEEELFCNSQHVCNPRDQLAAKLQGGYYGFLTSLYCNLGCPYCFQRAKADSCGFLSPHQVEKGLTAIKECEDRVTALAKEKTLPRISITGGEPLLRNKANLLVLDYLLKRLYELQWPYSITTNGTELVPFVKEHDLAENCRNIQVTLDGPPKMHNQRRHFRDGSPSFDRIVDGIHHALAAGWNITLRVNLDMLNVHYVPALAAFVKEQQWDTYEGFSAYVSPVTDHGAFEDYDTPKDEADLLLALLQVVEKSPIVREVFDIRHFKGFNYVERILLDKKPRLPVVYRCEAVMGMYIFDPRGDVHVCLEAAGDPSMRVGIYDPAWALDESALATWMQRHILNIEECNTCKIRFICAGGCMIDAVNHGNVANCMPFLREMEIAWQYYARVRPDLF